MRARCVRRGGVRGPAGRIPGAAGDTLHSIGALYGAGWRDVWSVNPGLVETTAVNQSSDEEGHNTPLDRVYALVRSESPGARPGPPPPPLCVSGPGPFASRSGPPRAPQRS